MKNFTFLKTLSVVAALLVGGANSIFADDTQGQTSVPEPVYLLNFEGATTVEDFGGVQHGDGELVTSADARFGTYYQNWPNATNGATSSFTNFLEIVPSVNPWATIRESQSNAFTISFWANATVARKAYQYPNRSAMFIGYTEDGTEADRTWYYVLGPSLHYGGEFHYNNAGWCDDTSHSSYTAWRENDLWHHFAWVFSGLDSRTQFTLTLYIDGVQQFSATETIKTIDSAKTTGFAMLDNLDRFVIGGAAPSWSSDIDNSFAYDDIALYNSALTKSQVKQVYTNKLLSGTQVGALDYSTAYLGDVSQKVKLYKGDVAEFHFKNYNNSSQNWENFLVPVYNTAGNEVIVVRADFFEVKKWSNSGCEANIVWDNFPAEMNGADVEMTVAYTSTGAFEMKSTITTSSGKSWYYNYSSSGLIDLSDNYIEVGLSVEKAYLDLLSQAQQVTIGELGWSTFASGNALDFSSVDEDLAAYTISATDWSSITTEDATTSIPAATGLLLQGTADTTYSIPVATSASTLSTTNCLIQGTGAAVAAESGKTRYVLTKLSDGTAGFKKIGSTSPTIALNKAYLEFTGEPAAQNSAQFLRLNPSTTAIDNVVPDTAAASTDGTYYNLAGLRVSYPSKGLYIVNGKVVVIK